MKKVLSTGMEQYQEWYDVLESQGFIRINEKVGNVDYRHPKKQKYTVYFDWMTFQVANDNGRIVFQTTQLTLGTLDEVIHAIKWPRTASDILKPKDF